MVDPKLSDVDSWRPQLDRSELLVAFFAGSKEGAKDVAIFTARLEVRCTHPQPARRRYADVH